MTRCLGWSCALLLLACRGEPLGPGGPPLGSHTAGSLVVRFEPDRLAGEASSPPELSLVIENTGKAPERLNRATLEVPQLAVDVFREEQRIPSLPPPVPRAPSDDDFVTIAPGAKWTQRVALTAFSPPLSAGTYRVRARSYPDAQAEVRLR